MQSDQHPRGDKDQAVFDRKEIAPDYAISYTDKTGTWTAKLTDVATGLETIKTFEVKK